MTRQLILGIDGGGSNTRAWLASCKPGEPPEVLGRGLSGASNPQGTSREMCQDSLMQAIEHAFQNAGLVREPVAVLTLALAGCGRHDVKEQLQAWSARCQLAHQVEVMNDAQAVLRAGTSQRVGVALVAGTGSFAFGMNSDGEHARAGGWGFLFGDEGSGYAIGVAGLRAVTRAVDKRGPATQITRFMLSALQLQEPQQLISELCVTPPPRGQIAALTECVISAASEGDEEVCAILTTAVDDLTGLVLCVGRNLNFSAGEYELATAGGVLVNEPQLRQRLHAALEAEEFAPTSIRVVAEPVKGALQLACELLGD